MCPNDDFPFLAQSLSSRQLLALLFLCEKKRKGDTDWHGFIEAFAPRLENLDEELRVQVIAAHLMSVEDLDIYDDGTLEIMVRENVDELGKLERAIQNDSRFA